MKVLTVIALLLMTALVVFAITIGLLHLVWMAFVAMLVMWGSETIQPKR